jgi:hypothetical protein
MLKSFATVRARPRARKGHLTPEKHRGRALPNRITSYWFSENYAHPNGWDGFLDQGN